MKVKLCNTYDTDTLIGSNGNVCNVGEGVKISYFKWLNHIFSHIAKNYCYCSSACQYHTYYSIYEVLLSCGNPCACFCYLFEYYNTAWSLYFECDVFSVENVHRNFRKHLCGCSNLSYVDHRSRRRMQQNKKRKSHVFGLWKTKQPKSNDM